MNAKTKIIQKQPGNVVANNTSLKAIRKAQKAFRGAAEKLGVQNDDDIQALVDEVRYGKNSI